MQVISEKNGLIAEVRTKLQMDGKRQISVDNQLGIFHAASTSGLK